MIAPSLPLDKSTVAVYTNLQTIKGMKSLKTSTSQMKKPTNKGLHASRTLHLKQKYEWVQASGDGRGPGQWGSQRGFLDNEHAIWMGDLNYRLTIPDEQVFSHSPSVARTLHVLQLSFSLDTRTDIIHVRYAVGKAHAIGASSQIGRAVGTASYLHLPVSLFVCLSLSLSLCLSVCMSVCLSACLYMHTCI